MAAEPNLSIEADLSHGQGDGLWPSLGWQPAAQQLAQFLALQELLRDWNRRLNLTRLVEGDDYWIAQLYDSLWPWREQLRGEQGPLSLIDVGTGGGFPGLALAIALPAARVTLVDSVGRKAEAVRAMAAGLGLEQRVIVRCERVETTGQDPSCRGRFDWAMARAVAAAPVVAEYLVPLLQPSGRALLYRGQWELDDQQTLTRALLPLQATVERVERRELPAGRGVRHAVLLKPVGPCPLTYPRPVGVPAKLPLGSE
ncbi:MULTISPECIES: 16S rRNA (guanine(527)-N(7))-methyltransferase RsmG [unclassified Synechococcus]|uniref:16S rRNA (guanine(527)-N(7))-methyltransferase RsmG n=1 Tax=unclassified Synechococcus TaxID=2626047 RepID=UPI0021A30259|nr:MULTISPECIES: 16S rRNA (guanine(527)-N(7))-methyltransferase RsmG [unclassified Synechococcus]MCT0213391.1 16S rRNA (guanine(527)-N(7))-methyltransferase RsmG [Synechococcus sp. CS-1326]MCT0232755.1 16S rRNA (guanine(527)-N(7))-methyltransferase RsmG [Synechococcus sp. CS-1327]